MTEYDCALNVYIKFEMKTMKDYHNLYLKFDVLLLADAFGKSKRNSLKNYLTDPDIYIFFEKVTAGWMVLYF